MCLQMDDKPKESGHYQEIPSPWELVYFRLFLIMLSYIYIYDTKTLWEKSRAFYLNNLPTIILLLIFPIPLRRKDSLNVRRLERWCNWCFPHRSFMKVKVTQSCTTLCDPMDCSSWSSPGQNTGVCSLSLLQGIIPI